MTLTSPLGRYVPRAPADPEEVDALRRKALIEAGIASIRLNDVRDPLTRQIIRGEAERQLGLRG